MKIIENECRQPRRFADSDGWLKIELEPGDDRDAIIKQYHKPKQHWADESCEFCPSKSTETLLVFKRHQVFLD